MPNSTHLCISSSPLKWNLKMPILCLQASNCNFFVAATALKQNVVKDAMPALCMASLDFQVREKKNSEELTRGTSRKSEVGGVLRKTTLQGTNISHLGKRKIVFQSALGGDMLVPRRVTWRWLEDPPMFQ